MVPVAVCAVADTASRRSIDSSTHTRCIELLWAALDATGSGRVKKWRQSDCEGGWYHSALTPLFIGEERSMRLHHAALASVFVLLASVSLDAQQPATPAAGARLPSIADRTTGMRKIDGFIPIYWDDRTGSMFLEIAQIGRASC